MQSNSQPCSTAYAQRFLDQLVPQYCTLDEYIAQVHQSDTGGDESMIDSEAIYSSTLEQCQFCAEFYSTADEFAESVGLFLHKESSTVLAKFVAKAENNAPVLLAPNTAEQICLFCFKSLVNEEIPRILRSFEVTPRDLDECFPSSANFPRVLTGLVLQYANSEYSTKPSRSLV